MKVANEYLKKCSLSLGKCNLKLHWHSGQSEWLPLSKQITTNCGKEVRKKCKILQLQWKSGWRFIKKLKVELPYEVAIPAVYAQKNYVCGTCPKGLHQWYMPKKSISIVDLQKGYVCRTCPNRLYQWHMQKDYVSGSCPKGYYNQHITEMLKHLCLLLQYL